ncbi:MULTISPECIES: dTDP-4-dehydrorhamnose 3,5-epimerase [unclassified Aureimonas]|uniref:dTDP-4-dehydrorhamnose 3,5-epimerase n=1 Tax=unclassified Aureimonas TaxID=2615206 RepID=UPI0006F469D8|nr:MULTISPECIES: dTDP-4-dehydrorhamnose 3,5-epimerase [unclassified Aureimonas]KQT60483.1 dTDP-4-dehydrorhamnose 3,5-epimerase [Aureimonas sp. Leaf427]KQT79360.1 dTDP-4-dehydrorhamnose 3,5-epimerase [Aureimonas sp. Leaf460]
MIFHETDLKDARLIDIEPRGDERGWFGRTFCADEFGKQGLETIFVQQNASVSAEKGTVRGMHFQRPPHGEVKLLRCLRGAILDVIIDLRRSSPTFLRHQGFELSAENRRLLYVPKGFAHGFQTLTDDVEVSYLVSSPYTPASEGGVRFDDPLFGIEWPLPVSVISEKDAKWALVTPETYPDL